MSLQACSSAPVDQQTPSDDPKDQKIEMLTTALSRAQSRIEELDAKVAALTDKVESTRTTLENATGMSKPVVTEAVGSAKTPKARAPKDTVMVRVDEATVDFSNAMNLFKAGKYPDAELAFNHFTEKYPEHVLAGSAQFYAGESYLMMGEYNLATNEYSKVISTFSSSPRVGSAMVRLAQCYEAAGAPREAKKTMELAQRMFEGSPALEMPAPSKPNAAAAQETAAPAAPASELNTGVMEPPAATEQH